MNRSTLFASLAALAAAPTIAFAIDMNADTNHDGKVSLKEYQTSRWNFIKKGDKNNDGRISAKEWQDEATQVRMELQNDGVKNADIVGKGGVFEKMDANHDGAVTQAESDAYFAGHFALIDTNHDGSITAPEGVAAMKAAQASIDAKKK